MDFRDALLKRMVIALLAVQGISTAFLLTLDALNAVSEAQFTLVLGVNLVALDMVIYVYRTLKLSDPVKLKWMAGGVLMIVLLVATALFLH